MTTRLKRRILVLSWALALVGSLALWGTSYLNYSYYSRQRAYGFMWGAFCWNQREPGTWGAHPIFPDDTGWWSWGTYTPGETSCYVVIKPGKARPYWRIEQTPANGGLPRNGHLMRIDGRWTYFGFFGWELIWKPYVSRAMITLPLWIPPLILLIVAIRPIWRHRTLQQRAGRGQCLCCGYSLTGNVSGVCPECGKRI